MAPLTARCLFVCAVFLASANGQTGRAQPLDAAPALFSPVSALRDGHADALQAPDSGARHAEVALDRLTGERLLLNLLDGVSFEARRQHTDQWSDGTAVWSGQIERDPLSAVTFVRSGPIVQGTIRTAAGSYSVEPMGDGPIHVIRRVDTRVAPAELPPLVPPVPAAGDLPAVAAAASPQPDDGGTVDVLVFYTTAARQQAGGSEAAVRARIALGVAETNVAYANSGVAHRVRLVGAELVGYRESGDLSEDLQRLTSDGDGQMDIVHARRPAAGADLVSLIVGSTAGGACGVAWVMQDLSIGFAPYAFSVTAYPCISPNYTFGHELAHNMGTAHAPEDPNAPPVLPYAYGYKDPAQRFRTVMAYDCPAGCPRVLHFSSPMATYEGEPTGTPALQNNALALNQTAPSVANFRQARPLPALVSAPGDIRVDATGTTVTLSWDRPGAGVPTHYQIEVGTREGLADRASFEVPGDATSVVQAHVPPGTYFLRVRAFDAFGPGPPSATVPLLMTDEGRCVTPPAAPTLEAPLVAGGTVTLSWQEAGAGGQVDRYVVGVGRRAQSIDAAFIDTRSTSTAFTSQAGPGVYFVRVAGVNGCGIGAASNEVGVVVGPPIPGPPVGLTAAVGAGRVVTLTWQSSGAGGAPGAHVVEAGSAPGRSDVAILPSPGPTPSFTVVAPPGRYYVRVRAVNEHGISTPSEEIAVRVF
jgi:hypothetical protein